MAKAKIEVIKPSISDSLILQKIYEKESSDEWIKEMHKLSVNEGHTFEKQLLLSIIDEIVLTDATVTKEEAVLLKEKYKMF